MRNLIMINKLLVCTISCLAFLSMNARDILLEIKGAGFFPTSHIYKKIYHSSGIFGAEATVNMFQNLYAWASIDGLGKKGLSIIGLTPTQVTYIPLCFGLKYIHSFEYAGWYVGLGLLLAHIHTHDYSPFVVPLYSKWGVGGIGKLGCIIDIRPQTFIDLFFNYSFVKAGSHNTDNGMVYPHAAKIRGCMVGVGLGYRF